MQHLFQINILLWTIIHVQMVLELTSFNILIHEYGEMNVP